MPQFTITLQDAQQRLADWENEQTAIKNELIQHPGLLNSPTLDIRAFTFHWNDIAELLNRILLQNDPKAKQLVPIMSDAVEGTTQINALRFYLGKQVIETNPVPPYACLIGVGVSGFHPQLGIGGEDIIELPLLPVMPQEAPVSAIYDFSYPCPTTCPNIGEGLKDMSAMQPIQG